MLWLSGPIFVLMFFFLPETSASNILLRRAKRLRQMTGDHSFRSQSEIDQKSMTVHQVVNDALIKPWEINALDPAVLFSTFYTALVYGIFYSFFESFPLVYRPMYGFTLGASGLPFLSVAVSLMISIPAYCLHWHYAVERKMAVNGFGPPENRLIPGLVACSFIPIGLFLFGEWLLRSTFHLSKVNGVNVIF